MNDAEHPTSRGPQAETLRPVLRDVSVRLIALAKELDDSTVDATAISRTALYLERVVDRVRWVADMSGDEAGKMSPPW